MDPSAKNIYLLLPVENQVRELDAKLLLACVAALRGFPCIIGSRREIEMHISSFPRSIYVSKGLKSGNGRFFKLVRKLGHRVVAWDEEALVHLPQDIYYSRRLATVAMRNVDHLFAWGQDNADMWRQYPGLPPETPVHITGNPRGDLLRPELNAFYGEAAAAIRREHGDFVLVNTNFNHVNAFSPYQNLFEPAVNAETPPAFGEAGKGMTRDYAEGLRDHKTAVFRDFQEMIPFLDRSLKACNLVVRPHPTENPDIYHQIASRCRHVRVTSEGNIVPWLMAARGVVHNGCTTGVEAHVMGVPAISYRKTVNDRFDDGFYRLPNRLSQTCTSLDELQLTLQKVLANRSGPPAGEEQRALVDHYLAGREGALACERIMDVIEAMVGARRELPAPTLRDRLNGWYKLKRRNWKKRLKAYTPHSINKPAFQQHRYPGVTLDEVRTRTGKYQGLLQGDRRLQVEPIGAHFFKIRT